MSSFQTLIMSFMLISLALLQLCSASPVPMPADLAAAKLPSKPITAAPVLPTSTLPGTNLTFVYAAIGRGVQNYTCSGAGAAAVQLGAIADLYDGTAIAKASIATFNSIPGLAVNTAPPPAGGCFRLPPQFASLPKLGNHLFTADSTPAFLLTSVKKALFAKKLANAAAPAGAPVGPAGTGAVDWLQLDAKAGYATVGLGEVYRVETAGGKPTACTAAGVISVQYAAQYWFYA